MHYTDKHAHGRVPTQRQIIRSGLLHLVSKHLLEDQLFDVWLGDTTCMLSEVNTLFISVKELVSRVIRGVDTFITTEIAWICNVWHSEVMFLGDKYKTQKEMLWMTVECRSRGSEGDNMWAYVYVRWNIFTQWTKLTSKTECSMCTGVLYQQTEWHSNLFNAYSI